MAGTGEPGPGEVTGPGLVCATCGAVPEDLSRARLTWSRAKEDNREVWTCERCSREHLRSIEGKLDSTWW
jgi:hypothetical protein